MFSRISWNKTILHSYKFLYQMFLLTVKKLLWNINTLVIIFAHLLDLFLSFSQPLMSTKISLLIVFFWISFFFFTSFLILHRLFIQIILLSFHNSFIKYTIQWYILYIILSFYHTSQFFPCSPTNYTLSLLSDSHESIPNS